MRKKKMRLRRQKEKERWEAREVKGEVRTLGVQGLAWGSGLSISTEKIKKIKDMRQGCCYPTQL